MNEKKKRPAEPPERGVPSWVRPFIGVFLMMIRIAVRIIISERADSDTWPL